MINLLGLDPEDIKLLTAGKLNNYIGFRNPYKMHRIRKDQRLKKLKSLPAIYFLFCKKELVYIGKCTSLRDRICDHERGRLHLKGYYSKYDGKWRNSRTLPPKQFDTVAKIYVSLYAAEITEPIYIAYYRPKLNKAGIDKVSSQLSIFDD